ncbi:YihY/virulence factor BrkB family protein [Asinibacterium sp. OR53]|uniref:YihY/virulence factor BrkB family protein n=1 Tax=Asinibacterium sp. OR53 TaxID=925409 RepID=UPI00055ED22A|nr:YihY/virulence factor BrkB family protein [Asinibacterium sp. OR53]
MTKIERHIVNLAPIAWLINKSKVMVIPGFRGLPLYDVVRFFFRQINKVGLNERAAAISFNFIMAMPAALLFLFALLPYFPASASFEMEILKLFKDISPDSATYRFIKDILDGLLEKHVGVFSFGFILLIFYASNAIIGIIRTFDRSIQEQKGFFLYQRWRAIRLTGILVLLVIASALVLIGQEQLAGLLKNLFHMRRRARLPWWNGVRWFIITGLLFYCVAMIYKFAPSVKKRWHLVSPGSLLATALILVTTIAFSSWVSLFASSNYNRVYGSIGTVLILMLLIYLNSLILLIGFELNVSITYLTRKAEERNT